MYMQYYIVKKEINFKNTLFMRLISTYGAVVDEGGCPGDIST